MSFDVKLEQATFPTSHGMSLILRDIDLEIPRQSFLALMNLSSNGKTTHVSVMREMLQLRQGTNSSEGQPLRT